MAEAIARISSIMTTRPQMAVSKKVSGVASSRDKSKSVRAAHWNMARLTKSQIQIVDELDYAIVGFSECWGTATKLQDYGGVNRMLAAGHDPDAAPRR
jgi:hypothetical protein